MTPNFTLTPFRLALIVAAALALKKAELLEDPLLSGVADVVAETHCVEIGVALSDRTGVALVDGEAALVTLPVAVATAVELTDDDGLAVAV